MKTTLKLMSVLLLAPLGACFAMDSVTLITREQAKELGMEVRSKAAGPDAVWVELEFEIKGELKRITHVGLEMWAGKKLLLSSILRDNRPAPERVAVSFTADRSNLDKFTLKVLSHQGLGSVGYELRVKDLVDLEAEDAPKATGIRDAKKVKFPDKGIADGLKATVGLLESCRDASESQAGEFEKAQQEDHVRLVFAKPITVTVLDEKIDVTELVFRLPMNTGVFWLRTGNQVRRFTKYEPQKVEAFEAWLREAQPTD